MTSATVATQNLDRAHREQSSENIDHPLVYSTYRKSRSGRRHLHSYPQRAVPACRLRDDWKRRVATAGWHDDIKCLYDVHARIPGWDRGTKARTHRDIVEQAHTIRGRRRGERPKTRESVPTIHGEMLLRCHARLGDGVPALIGNLVLDVSKDTRRTQETDLIAARNCERVKRVRYLDKEIYTVTGLSARGDRNAVVTARRRRGNSKVRCDLGVRRGCNTHADAGASTHGWVRPEPSTTDGHTDREPN